MTEIDWERERQRLMARYAAIEDGELQKIAAEVSSSHPTAQEALRIDLHSRGIQIGASANSRDEPQRRSLRRERPSGVRRN